MTHDHIQHVVIFFICSILLLSADIITDIISAEDFFKQGDTNWGLSTLIPVFAPFGLQFIRAVFSYCRCYEYKKVELTPKLYFYLPTTTEKDLKLAQWKSELKMLHWHIPLLQPIRLVKYYVLGGGTHALHG